MKLIFSAGSLHTLPLPKVFEIAHDVGFDGVEVIVSDDFEYNKGTALLAEVSQILPVSSLHAPFFDINGWGNQIQQLEKTVELAIQNNIPLVNFHPPLWLTMDRQFWRWLNRINDFQQDVGHDQVTLTIENMPATGPLGCNPYFLSNTEAMIDFMNKHELFLTFDTAHMGTCKTNFLTDFHYCYDTGRIRNIHFSDYANGREHLLPGHGKLPLTRFLNHLRATGYDGTVTLELIPSELPDSEELIRQSLTDIYSYLCNETRTEFLNTG
jgi:sugar phosphate isomerase/epimerase